MINILQFMGWKTEQENWDWIEIRLDLGIIILGTLLITGAIHYG